MLAWLHLCRVSSLGQLLDVATKGDRIATLSGLNVTSTVDNLALATTRECDPSSKVKLALELLDRGLELVVGRAPGNQKVIDMEDESPEAACRLRSRSSRDTGLRDVFSIPGQSASCLPRATREVVHRQVHMLISAAS